MLLAVKGVSARCAPACLPARALHSSAGCSASEQQAPPTQSSGGGRKMSLQQPSTTPQKKTPHSPLTCSICAPLPSGGRPVRVCTTPQHAAGCPLLPRTQCTFPTAGEIGSRCRCRRARARRCCKVRGGGMSGDGDATACVSGKVPNFNFKYSTSKTNAHDMPHAHSPVQQQANKV